LLWVDVFSGEVVYDSILLKKQETKRYWEQLMMAARGREGRDARDAEPQLPLHQTQQVAYIRLSIPNLDSIHNY